MSIRLAASRALALGALFAAMASGLALGYAGQVAATVSVSGPAAQQSCGVEIPVSALIEEASGSPIAGQPVAWSFSSGAITGDRIISTSTTTDSTGMTTTHVVMACSAHTASVLAAADNVSGTVMITTTGKGLPRTDVAVGSGTSGLAVALAALAVLVGSGTILRRFAADRR